MAVVFAFEIGLHRTVAVRTHDEQDYEQDS